MGFTRVRQKQFQAMEHNIAMRTQDAYIRHGYEAACRTLEGMVQCVLESFTSGDGSASGIVNAKAYMDGARYRILTRLQERAQPDTLGSTADAYWTELRKLSTEQYAYARGDIVMLAALIRACRETFLGNLNIRQYAERMGVPMTDMETAIGLVCREVEQRYILSDGM